MVGPASAVYDKIAEPYAKKFSSPSQHLGEFLARVPKRGRILDVGCGPGIDAGYMASKGFDVIGIDASQVMIQIAKNKFPDMYFVRADMKKIRFPPSSFDGIVASCSLIHLRKKDVPGVLKKFFRLLKSDGVLYIALQGGRSRETYIDEPFKPDEKLFLNVFSFAEIRRLLIDNRFHIIKKYARAPKSKEELNFTKLYVMAVKK